jgi:hypothetical protein
MSLRRALALLPLPLALFGCTTDSSQVATSKITATIRAELIPGSNRVTVDMLADDLSSVKLVAGDTLSGKTDKDASLSFERSVGLYAADLPHDDITELTISLTRSSGTSAPASTVSIPPHLVVTSNKQAPYVAGGKLTLAWSNAVSGAQVGYWSRPCGSASIGLKEAQRVDDTGTLSIAMSELTQTAPPANGSCVTVTVIREITGTIDKAFESGSAIYGRRDDDVDVTLTP